MTTKSTPRTTPSAQDTSSDKAAATPATDTAHPPMETITLSHHLNIAGTEYPPGSRIRVSTDYARRLRRQGYVARG
ncbi:hypothetical protein [Streptomyces sp. bgisy060]|uniref:hypothetical protein n=1 Tax=Streptomyces sp. bgisy060 TaxID=3413775 RepID=UPI003EBDD352